MVDFLPPVVLDIMSKFDDSGIRRAQAAIRELDAMNARVQVKVDVDRGEVTALRAQLAALRDRTINIDIDVDGGAVARVGSAASSAVGPMSVLVGVGASLAPVIVPAAAAAAAGIVAIGSAATVAAAGLGTLVLGGMGVVKAVQAMGQAHSSAGGAARGAAGAASQLASAHDAVATATRGLAAAQRDARFAEEQLTVARESARRALEDINQQVADGEMAQRQGALNVRRALEDLRRVRADASSSALERAQARLTYEQAQSQLARLGVEQDRLRRDADAATRAGVDGSTQVRSAQERILDVQDRLVSATQALAAAHRQVEAASVSSGVAGGAAMGRLAEAMRELSPAGREFATFIYGLRDEFLTLRRTAESGLLPGIQRGIQALLPSFGALNDFVGRVAKTMGDSFEAMLKSLAGPEFKDFFSYVSDTAGPALRDMAEIAGNFVKGFLEVIVAFGPATEDMGKGLLGLSRSFAQWAASLKDSDRFGAFLDYARENGPRVVDLLLKLGVVALKLGEAVAPLGALILDGMVQAITMLSEQDPGVIAAVFAAIAVGAGAVAVALGGTTTVIGVAIGVAIGLIFALRAALQNAWDDHERFRAVVQAVWAGVQAAARVAWDSVLRPVFGFIVGAVEAVGAVLGWLLNNVMIPTWQIIGVVFMAGFKVVEMVAGLFIMNIKLMAAVFMWLWDHSLGPIWNKIRPMVLSFADLITGHLVSAFRSGVRIIGDIWDGLVNLVKQPIRLAVRVLNEGVIDNYNKLAGGPTISRLTLPSGFASGGVIPGVDRGVDSVLAMMRPGEGVLVPEATRALGGLAGISAINRAALSGGLGSPRVTPVGAGVPAQQVVHVHTHVVLDGREVAEVVEPHLIGVAQRTAFRSAMSGLA